MTIVLFYFFSVLYASQLEYNAYYRVYAFLTVSPQTEYYELCANGYDTGTMVLDCISCVPDKVANEWL